MLAFAGMPPEYECNSLRQKPRIRWISLSPSPSHPAGTILNESREARVSSDEGVGVCSDKRNIGFFQRTRDLVAEPSRSIKNRDLPELKPLFDELWDDRDGNSLGLQVMAIWDVPKAQIPFGGPVDTAVIALFAKRAQRSANDLSARTIVEA